MTRREVACGRQKRESKTEGLDHADWEPTWGKSAERARELRSGGELEVRIEACT